MLSRAAPYATHPEDALQVHMEEVAIRFVAIRFVALASKMDMQMSVKVLTYM